MDCKPDKLRRQAKTWRTGANDYFWRTWMVPLKEVTSNVA